MALRIRNRRRAHRPATGDRNAFVQAGPAAIGAAEDLIKMTVVTPSQLDGAISASQVAWPS
jgi:hypothetical protein